MQGETPKLRRFREIMHEAHALGGAVYEVEPVAGSSRIKVLGTFSVYAKTPEDHKEIADSLFDRAAWCARHRISRMMRPRVPDQIYPDGTGKFGFVIGDGAVRDSGYVVAVLLVAKDETEVQEWMTKTQAVFAASVR